MENKNTKELRGYKAGLKSKLMGAVAMLLVSAIMVSSATYAWFVLSTHPEVKGMSTTVGSNGALEIALLNNETGKEGGLAGITAGVGDSSIASGKSVRSANETWGNIVDLSDDSYGWANITLYPAVLNVNTATKNVLSRTNILKYAKYGTDGRVSELEANTAAGKASGSIFLSDPADYGVRAIGSTTAASEDAVLLASAQTKYANAVQEAVSKAKSALQTNQKQLSSIATTRASNSDNSAMVYTLEQVNSINGAADDLLASVTSLSTALQWSKAARLIAGGNQTATAENVTIESGDAEYTLKENLSALQTSIVAAKVAVSEGTTSFSWNDIGEKYQALMDTNTMTFRATTATSASFPNGMTLAQMQKIINGTAQEGEGTLNDLTKMTGGVEISLLAATSGASNIFSQIADYVGVISTKENTFTMSFVFNYNGSPQPLDANNTYYTANPVQAGKLTDITVAVGKLKITNDSGGTASAKAVISTTYGYVMDLAFKTNAAGNDLMLQGDGVNRVGGDATDNGTMGGGSSFTFAEGTSKADMEKAQKALRIVFVDKDMKILAVAAIAQDATIDAANTKYAIHVYSESYTTNGGTRLENAVEKDKITTLEQDTATAISAIVYLDGEYVDYAMSGVGENTGIRGTLNLQFCGSANLTPMSYTFNSGN